MRPRTPRNVLAKLALDPRPEIQAAVEYRNVQVNVTWLQDEDAG